MARVGILGGTFDPPHIGHIAIARAALKELRLEKILFIPARIPPHKTTRTAASPQDRLNMLYLALNGEAAFEISEIELAREGPSFTVDTLEELKKSRPYDQLFLIIGADNVAEIETWRDPEKIFELATVAAANRPNYTPGGGFAQAIIYFTMPATDVSSTVIRERLRSGIPVADMLSPDVEKYIREKGLYPNHA